MSQSLWHWIPWNPGQLSNLLHQLKLTCRLINLYPEIGFDVVTLTDNDAELDPSQCQWILNYILLLLLMNVISVDTSISWFFFIKIILHLQIYCTFYLFFPMILLVAGIILLTIRFCTTTNIATISLLIFSVIFIQSGQL